MAIFPALQKLTHIYEYFQAGHVHILELLLSRGADLMARYKNVSFEFAHALKTRDIEESTVKCIVASKLVSKQEIDKYLFATKPLTPRGHQGDSLLHCGASTARLDVVDFCIKVWK